MSAALVTSRYNFHVPVEGGALLYNSSSGSVLRFGGRDGVQVAAALSGPVARFSAGVLPDAVVADLQALAGEHEPVLLCYERPPFSPANWCHRRMVAEWLADKIGLDVLELERGDGTAPPAPGGNPTLI